MVNHYSILYAVSMPIVSASIGWLTNKVALWMLFHPREERRMCGVRIQGLLPARQNELAEKIAFLVSEHLLNPEEVVDSIDFYSLARSMKPKIKMDIDRAITEAIPVGALVPLLVPLLSDALTEIVAALIVNLLPKMKESLRENADVIDVSGIIEAKIKSYSTDRFEETVRGIAQKEFTAIEVTGAVLGFVIGLAQALFFVYARWR